MNNNPRFFEKAKRAILYGGLSKEEYDLVHDQVDKANHKALTHWSVLVSCFWLYCLLMSLKAPEYTRCRPAYAVSLGVCIFCFLCSFFVVRRFPKTLPVFKYVFRLSLLGGGIGIAMCQGNLRSLTLFAVAIVSPSIFVDSTLASLVVHISALILYVLLGKGPIEPAIYSWGLGNYILFSIFGFFIGNAINKERFERYLFAESEKRLAEAQARYAYYDQLTGLLNRRAYEEKLAELAQNAPEEFCVIAADVNGLKQTNDTIGHRAGDELLTGTSECLVRAFEGVDSIYRIGGDEFSVILEGSPEEAQKRLARFDELLLRWHGRTIASLSVSTGVASNKGHRDIESILVEADENMYVSKRDHYHRQTARI